MNRPAVNVHKIAITSCFYADLQEAFSFVLGSWTTLECIFNIALHLNQQVNLKFQMHETSDDL